MADLNANGFRKLDCSVGLLEETTSTRNTVTNYSLYIDDTDSSHVPTVNSTRRKTYCWNLFYREHSVPITLSILHQPTRG